MRIKNIIPAVAAAVSMTLLCSCGEAPVLRLGTGNTGGIYYAYGSTLRELDESGIEVKKTAGSQANMRLMNEGFLDLAIVQSDVLADAAGGSGEFVSTPVSGVRAVAGLYYEAFHLIVRSDSGIESIADLKGRTLSVGEEGSGVSKNAEYLFTSAGLPFSSVETVNLSYTESAQALESGSIDAFLAVLGTPSAVVSELFESGSVRILPLDERTVSAMTSIYDGYYAMSIPAGTYRGQTEDIPTIGVKAVLTADSRVSGSDIRTLTELLFKNGGSIRYSVSMPEPDIDFAVTDIPCAFHEGAAEYYQSVGITVSTDAAVQKN